MQQTYEEKIFKVRNPKSGKDVVAICLGDVHLSHTPPLFRSKEINWYSVMKRPLNEIKDLMKKHQCPVLYAGDLFDKWNPPLELVNWSMENIPPGFAVPGNHDLRHHNYGDIKKCAYYTLCCMGIIRNVEPNRPIAIDNLVLHGFPCGHSLKPCTQPIKEFALQVALVHSYIWTKNTGYMNAPEDEKLAAYEKKLRGYEVSIFGDNHKGFKAIVDHQKGDAKQTPKQTTVINCGSLMIRKSNERSYQPRVYLLHADGGTTPHYLDTSKDVYLDEKEVKQAQKEGLDLSDFTEGVEDLSSTSLEVMEMVERILKKAKAHAQLITKVLKAFEKE